MALLCAFVQGSRGERTAHTRIFRPAGTYASHISVSPAGTVVARSGDSSVITLLDGYSRREIALPEESTFRAYQSRSGQIWTIAPTGVWLYHQGAWTMHPIAEIRNELLNNPIAQVRQISLLPAEVNHLLILLHDRLLDYDATTRQVRILKEAHATRLGDFAEIQEGTDESIWVSGTYGIAHVQGPARRITPQTLWGEYLLGETNRVNTLQRPYESPPGKVTAVATPSSPSGDNSRYIVEWENDAWQLTVIPTEKIRQAWTAWDGTVWGYSANSLFRVVPGTPPLLRREPVAGSQYDVAVETNGVCWIASSEGLVRHAPFLWRSRPDLEDLQTAVHAVVFDQKDVWLATTEGLLRTGRAGRQLYAWPEEIENLVPPRESLFRLEDGRFLVAAQTRPVIFEPETGRFSRLRTSRAVHVHLLGQLMDGSVCAWFEHNDKTAPVDLRLYKEGAFVPLEIGVTNVLHGELAFAKEISKGDLWIGGGSSGMIRYKLASGNIEIHGMEQGLPSDRILTISAVGEGRIWCGTASRVYEYRGRRWEPVLAGLDRISAIVPAGGSVWVATAAGIYRYFQDSWIYHGVNEGIPSGAVYALRTSPNDLLWAGTSRGTVIFHPDADPDPPHTLPPTLQDSQKPSTLVPTAINFRGQDKWDYTAGGDLLFSYKLDEGGWTPFSNTVSRTFQNLSAGEHVLEVLAMDRNGNKAPVPNRLEFAVVAPWFRDPRLLSVSVLALALTLSLAGLAVAKHLQLKRSYAEVEQIVAQRTAQLERANQELLHSQKMRAIGTMAAGIAHDFNNILSIIKGSAQIIEGNIQDREKIHTRVNRIKLVVEQGTTIVKALLGLGRMDDREVGPCDISDLLHQTRKLLSDRFPETIQVQVDVAPDLPPIECSQEVLQQMLLNFILNAVDATGNEGVIQLSAREVSSLPMKMVLEPSRAESYLIISVADQGGGISPEILPRIFEPFFTTKAFSSRRGTGLGLSMAYELAKGLGYGLAVATNLGEGSTFSILLPYVTTPAGKKRAEQLRQASSV